MDIIKVSRVLKDIAYRPDTALRSSHGKQPLNCKAIMGFLWDIQEPGISSVDTSTELSADPGTRSYLLARFSALLAPGAGHDKDVIAI